MLTNSTAYGETVLEYVIEFSSHDSDSYKLIKPPSVDVIWVISSPSFINKLPSGVCLSSAPEISVEILVWTWEEGS